MKKRDPKKAKYGQEGHGKHVGVVFAKNLGLSRVSSTTLQHDEREERRGLKKGTGVFQEKKKNHGIVP